MPGLNELRPPAKWAHLKFHWLTDKDHELFDARAALRALAEMKEADNDRT